MEETRILKEVPNLEYIYSRKIPIRKLSPKRGICYEAAAGRSLHYSRVDVICQRAPRGVQECRRAQYTAPQPVLATFSWLTWQSAIDVIEVFKPCRMKAESRFKA